MKAQGFLTKASKLSEKGMSRFLPLIVMAGTIAVLSAGNVNAETVIENTAQSAASQSIHVVHAHMTPR